MLHRTWIFAWVLEICLGRHACTASSLPTFSRPRRWTPKTLQARLTEEPVAGNDGVCLAHPSVPNLYLATYPAPPCDTGNVLCVRLYIYTYTRTIDFSSLCAEEELNHAQARTAVGWSPAQGGRAERLFKETLISEVQTDPGGTEATEAARGQWVSSLRLSAEPRMEAALSTAGRLHRCRNSDSRRLQAQRLPMFKVGRWKTRDFGTGCLS